MVVGAGSGSEERGRGRAGQSEEGSVDAGQRLEEEGRRRGRPRRLVIPAQHHPRERLVAGAAAKRKIRRAVRRVVSW